MGRQVIVSAAPPGSQRKRDYTYPDPNGPMSGAPSLVQRGRYGGTTNTTGSAGVGTTGALTMGFVAGVPCARLTNGVNLNQGPVAVIDGGTRLHPALLTGPGGAGGGSVRFTQLVDDYAAIRVYAVMRVPASPANATDCGLCCVLGANASLGILKDLVPGWSFNYDTTGTVSYIQHGNSGAQTATRISPTVASGFLNTDWHMVEFRILSATATTNAQLKILFDGQVQIVKSWGNVPDDLPTPNSPGANNNNGFVVNVQYMAQNGEIDVALVRSQAAPTENALF